jgi:hypothetical protein
VFTTGQSFWACCGLTNLFEPQGAQSLLDLLAAADTLLDRWGNAFRKEQMELLLTKRHFLGQFLEGVDDLARTALTGEIPIRSRIEQVGGQRLIVRGPVRGRVGPVEQNLDNGAAALTRSGRVDGITGVS